MNKILIRIVFAFGAIFSFVQCGNNSGNEINNADHRAKVISELMDNENYMKEVKDAMKSINGEAMVSNSYDLMKEDTATGTKMMGMMMDMCKSDTSMYKMMMGKTMEMCDMDKEKCKMMMAAMRQHPMGMKNIKDLGMCDMNMSKMQ
ncbi:MAG: hypothetical protein IPN29_04220 [Saprospiraceae bacterium]|nr:hypothetical protein [Saprospiraceae bacterium]